MMMMRGAGIAAALAVLSLFLRVQSYPPPANCSGAMSKWCNVPANCPHSAQRPVQVALFDTNAERQPRQWRCYDPDDLDAATHTSYVGGTDYCTRDAELRAILQQCWPDWPAPAPSPLPPAPVAPARSTVFTHGEGGFPCIRIPAITLVGGGSGSGGDDADTTALLAFAECRDRIGDGCDVKPSVNNTGKEWVCMKKSTDSGHTWSPTLKFSPPNRNFLLSTTTLRVHESGSTHAGT